MLPKFGKRSFNSGFVIPTKMRFCKECNGKILCTKCENQVNETKVFGAYFKFIRSKSS